MPFVGLGVGIGRQRFGVGGGGGFDADYQAVLNYATTQGYTLPSAGQQLLQNQLVLDLKDAGVWNKLDTFGVFATDGDSDFALIDWIRLTDYTAVNSPTFTTDEGFQGNGTSSYIRTGFIPSTATKYLLDSASQGFWMNSGTIGARTNLGSREAFNNKMSYDYNQSIQINGNTQTSRAGSTTSKFYMYNRKDNANVERFINGISIGSDANPSTSKNSFEFYVFAINNGGSPLGHSSNELSFIFTGASLATESLSFYNSLNTYMTSL